MLKKRSLQVVFVLVGVSLFCWATSAVARQNIVIGGVGVGYNFWERSYDDESSLLDTDTGDRREFSVWPEFELQSRGIHDTLSFHYSPVVTYDDLISETDVDHYLTLGWIQQWTRQWSFELANAFAFSSDPTRSITPFASDLEGEDAALEEIPADEELSTNLGSRRYWSNNLELATVYSYAELSNVELGYGYRVLRNDSGGDDAILYDEYDRHGVTGRWAHRYSPSWSSELGLRYYKGLYDELGDEGLSQDLQEYRADVQVDYNRSVQTVFPVIYRYQRADYEDLRQDVWGQELAFGWDHAIDSRRNIIIAAGPSYAKSEDLGGELGYNFYFNYTKAYRQGSVEGLINKRYMSRNFSGISDGGLSDTTDFRVDASYQLNRDLSFDVFGLYRYEEILNPEGEYYIAALGGGDPLAERDLGDVTYVREGYSAGAGLSYSFLRWFVASLSYVYYQQDGDVSSDAYEDHRVLVQLTARRELWR